MLLAGYLTVKNCSIQNFEPTVASLKSVNSVPFQLSVKSKGSSEDHSYTPALINANLNLKLLIRLNRFRRTIKTRIKKQVQ